MPVGKFGIFHWLGGSQGRKQDYKCSHSNNYFFFSFGLRLAGSQFPDQGLNSSQGNESLGS